MCLHGCIVRRTETYLYDLRFAAGLTRKQAAALCGVSYGCWGARERGDVMMRPLLSAEGVQLLKARASKCILGYRRNQPWMVHEEERSKAMKTVKMRIQGVAPLLMHNARLADPTDPITKEKAKISKGRNKTEDVLLQIKELEWRGGLYLDEKGRPAIPADVALATVINGARKAKLGKEAQAAVYCEKPFFKLEYDGPKDLDKLYADGRFCDYRTVVQQRQRIMRARPIFRDWACDIEVQVDEEIINVDQVREAMIAAGTRVGMGDFRPRYGRFTVE